jgi:putative DNA primase/helicase
MRGEFDFAACMDRVAIDIFGAPEPRNQTGSKWRYGRNGSLLVDVEKGTWYDFEQQQGGGVLDLIRVKKGLEGADAIDYLRELGCVVPEREPKKAKGKPQGKPTDVDFFDYRDEQGELRYQVVRRQWRLPDGSYDRDEHGKIRKTFRQRRPDGQGGWFDKSGCMAGVEPLPYRLPGILEAISFGHTILIGEGEKVANFLWTWQLPGTCNHGGAGKWKPELGRWFEGAHIVILPDNDAAGRGHLHSVANQLHRIAATIRYLELPDLPEKGDVIDWAANGGTREQLDQLLEQAKIWEPPDPNVPPTWSDEHIALEFAERHKDELRYTAKWGRWYAFNGLRWREDATLATLDWVRRLCRQFAIAALAAMVKPKEAQAIASKVKVAAVEALSKSDRRLAASVEQWDAEPFMFNTPKGIVDTKKSRLRLVVDNVECVP